MSLLERIKYYLQCVKIQFSIGHILHITYHKVFHSWTRKQIRITEIHIVICSRLLEWCKLICFKEINQCISLIHTHDLMWNDCTSSGIHPCTTFKFKPSSHDMSKNATIGVYKTLNFENQWFEQEEVVSKTLEDNMYILYLITIESDHHLCFYSHIFF